MWGTVGMACWVVLACFLVPACVRHLLWVVGVGALWGWALSVFGEHAHCRVHVQHRVSVCCPVVGWWVPAQSAWIVCGVGVGVCGGLFVLCIVVASVFVLYCFLCFV